MIRFAVIGTNWITRQFVDAAHETGKYKLTAVYSRSLEQAQSFANDYPVEHLFTSLEAMAQSDDVDAVYIASPNSLHFPQTELFLRHKKHVICEKPFTIKSAELIELKELAESKKLILVEAITTRYLSNYLAIKEQIPQLGDLKIIECNYSQYSSRYDAFKKGEVLPAFSPKAGGGALMDINIYNIHFVVGILGKPESVKYLANVERGIDTSGILLLDYPGCKVVCIGAKNSAAPIRSMIQGDKGSVVLNGPPNLCNSFDVNMNGQASQSMDKKVHPHRMYEEFREFARMIDEMDLAKAKDMLEQSQVVMEIAEEALAGAGIVLG